jgi:hypothetical protein
MMEQSIEKLDFEEIDQIVQVHGTSPSLDNILLNDFGGSAECLIVLGGTDYEGVSFSSRDANSKNAASEATSIFQSHYPEFLVSFPPIHHFASTTHPLVPDHKSNPHLAQSRKFFINVPTVLSWIFWAFKSLVSSQTFAKMSVVGSGQQTIARALGGVIDVKEIPKRYGGQAEGF